MTRCNGSCQQLHSAFEQKRLVPLMVGVQHMDDGPQA